MTIAHKLLAVLALFLAACAGNPRPRVTEVSKPAPSLVNLCHVIEEECSWLEVDERGLWREYGAVED